MERVVIPPDMSPREVEQAVAEARVVQFHEPLPPRLLAALAEALTERPEVELYYYGWAETPPLKEFEQLLDALVDHRSIERLDLSFGSATNLGALATMPSLRDVEIWQIKRLDSPALRPLAEVERLRSLSLGAARNVERLDFLRPTLRYLTLEKVPSLDTLAPLAELSELRALGLFESRPADRSLKPLPDGLRDVIIGDVFPKAEVEALVDRLPEAGLSIRGRVYRRASRLGWRGLAAYIDGEERGGHQLR